MDDNRNECSIIKVLHHPNIIRYYETYETKDTIYIVCEYLKDGQLFDYVLQNEYLEEYEASYIFKQLLRTLNYLHNSGIVHRDLKPENILITKEKKEGEFFNHVKTVKLIDFGFACYMTDEANMSDLVGTPNYTAPEVYLGQNTEVSDNFSLGVILYFMYAIILLRLRGVLPFYSPVQDLVMRKTIKSDYQISDAHWANISPEAVDLTTRLLENDPKKRISLIESLVHPWIRDRDSLKKYDQVNRVKEGEESLNESKEKSKIIENN